MNLCFNCILFFFHAGNTWVCRIGVILFAIIKLLCTVYCGKHGKKNVFRRTVVCFVMSTFHFLEFYILFLETRLWKERLFQKFKLSASLFPFWQKRKSVNICTKFVMLLSGRTIVFYLLKRKQMLSLLEIKISKHCFLL